MSGHLNPEQIDRRLAGERDSGAENHLLACAACRDAVARMESALARLHGSMQAWSESQAQSRPPANWTSCAETAIARRRRMAPARWAAIAAAALVLAAVPVYRNLSERRAAAQARADAVLLEEVAADISREAPEPLEPLVDLVSQTKTGENK